MWVAYLAAAVAWMLVMVGILAWWLLIAVAFVVRWIRTGSPFDQPEREEEVYGIHGYRHSDTLVR